MIVWRTARRAPKPPVYQFRPGVGSGTWSASATGPAMYWFLSR